MKADVYGVEIGAVVRDVELTHAKAVWLSEQPIVQAVVCESSFHGFKTIYQDGTMRQWDSAGRVLSGKHASFEGRIGWH